MKLTFPAGLMLLGASVVAQGQDLQVILARLDQSAPSFKAMSSHVRRVTHTAVIDDNTTDVGSMIMKRAHANSVEALIQFTEPDQRSILLENGKLEIFYPKLNTVQIYELGKSSREIDEYLLIGFGTSGMELSRDFDLKLLPEENISGQRATKLQLVPKAEKVRERFSKIELWLVDQAKGLYPAQEKIYQQNGDYQLATYTDLKINPQLSSGNLALKLPPGVKTEYPQKSQ